MDDRLAIGLGEIKFGVQALARQRNKAEAERDDLAARVARVEALHQPTTRTYYHATVTECSLCTGRAYPCPTIKALRGESE